MDKVKSSKINSNGTLNKVGTENMLALAGDDQELLVKGLDGNQESLEQLALKILENSGLEVETKKKRDRKPLKVLSHGIINVVEGANLFEARIETYNDNGTVRRTVTYTWDGRAAGPCVSKVRGRALNPKVCKMSWARIKTVAKRILQEIMEEKGVSREDMGWGAEEAVEQDQPEDL